MNASKIVDLSACPFCGNVAIDFHRDYMQVECRYCEARGLANASLPPLVEGPRRKIRITIEVAVDFEKRLDNQWEVEREINADRWTWDWLDELEEFYLPNN